MNNNIIIGNGVNINFDKDKKRWKEFILNCQTNFLILLNEAKNSQNVQINSIYQVWKIIKKYIEFDKELKSIENITRFFNFWNFKDFMSGQEEYIEFLNEIWINTICPFLKEDDFPIEVPNFLESPALLFQVNTHLDTISKIYKKAIEITLFNDYDIHKINIPSHFINFIIKNYNTKISLNYDHNLNEIKDIIKLHGNYQTNLINYYKAADVPSEYSEFVDFIKNNTLQWDMVLEKSSKTKKRQLDVLNNWKKHGVAPTLRYFGIYNKFINTKNIEVNNVFTYDILNEMSGIIEIIGMSTENDELILNALMENKKIKKIIFYSDENKKVNSKLEYKKYDNFWQNLNNYMK